MPKRDPLIFIIDWNACLKCGACVAICPQKSSFISPFDTIAVDKACGIACLDCETICPVTAISNRTAEGTEPVVI